MDEKSLQTLEFDKICRIVAQYTSFSAGEALALSLRPTADPDQARRWQAETREAIDLLDKHPTVTIGGARDVRRAADNAQRGFTLLAEDLLDIRNTIVAARNLRRQLLKLADTYPHLAAIAELIEECAGIVSAINSTIDERGEVLDSASPTLARIRQEQRTIYGRIQDKLQRILNSKLNQYLQEPIITMRSGRYVIPLKAEHKGRIKGIVHDHSSSGATLWVEPIGTVDLNNEYRSLQIAEQDEINRILAALSAEIGRQGEAIKRIVARLAELDLILARARYATVTNAIEPQFIEWRKPAQNKPPKHANQRQKWTPPPYNPHPGSTIWIKAARHPLLDPDTVVPTNLTLDENTFIVLITGPNTGGKTVSLKTTGLMVLMAQSGLHLPATEARLTIFRNVFADIGDEQSIEQNLSTFSAHMSNIVRILKQVDERSLVLLDELGSGTDPAEGAALAQAIVSYLRDKGTTTFVATHYPELKVYASQTPGATNASLLFDLETLSPTYEMTIGLPGRSNAFAIARRLGLDETILDEAMRLLGTGSHKAEDMLDSIYELREKIESEEAKTRLILRQVETEREELQKRLADIEREREQVLAAARAEAEAELEALREEIRQIRKQLRDVQSLNQLKKMGRQVDELAEKQVEAVGKTAVSPPTPSRSRRKKRTQIQIGDIVRIKTLGATGEVVSLGKKDVVVALGQMQMRARWEDLELQESPKTKPEPEPELVPMAQSPGIELDLRGKQVEEALTILDKYLDDAFLARLPWVRIIHGKGTGRLRQAVRKALNHHAHVASWEEGKDGEGGAGVTVAKLASDN